MPAPLRIEVLQGASLTPVAALTDPVSVQVVPMFNRAGQATVELTNTHRHAGKLIAEGSRATITGAFGQLMTGYVSGRSGNGRPDGTVTFTFTDSFTEIFDKIKAWPVPTASLDNQSVTYYTLTGPAETVMKTVVAANVARLKADGAVMPDIVCAPDQGRGDTIKVKWRFHPIGDRLFPAYTNAGLGVSVTQVGSQLVVDSYEPRVFPQVITPRSGIVSDWEWDHNAPSVTRVVAGGQGEGTARRFLKYVSPTSESTWGATFEDFADARDVDNDTDLLARAQQARDEGSSTTGIKLTLTQSATFEYGRHLRVGDSARTQLVPGGPVTTHTVTEATVNWDKDSGFTADPAVGEITDSPSRRTWFAINKNAKKLRDQGTV